MNPQVNQDEINVIRTFECELCLRFDSIMMSKEELLDRVFSNDLEIGTYLISHGDHNRIIYFNEQSEYLGDIISLNMDQNDDNIGLQTLPLFQKSSKTLLNSIKTKLLKLFLQTSQKLTIVGPSYVGKTSLALFLETGIPERNNGHMRRSPTLYKSVKHIKLGRSNLSIFDMGGQKDYWNGWNNELPDSDKIIFIVDGTANNSKESAEAFDLILKNRVKNTKILFLINKYDLVLDGYSNSFTEDSSIISKLQNNNNTDNIWALKTSVFNGICYNYNKNEETSLLQVIIDFIQSE